MWRDELARLFEVRGWRSDAGSIRSRAIDCAYLRQYLSQPGCWHLYIVADNATEEEVRYVA